MANPRATSRSVFWVLAFVLVGLCRCAPSAQVPQQALQPGQQPWRAFQVWLHDIAWQVIEASPRASDTQLTFDIYKAILFGPVKEDERLGGQFNNYFEIVVWKTTIRSQFQAQCEIGYSLVGPHAVAINGMIANHRCLGEASNLPPPATIGAQGWPCFRGGAVPVQHPTSTSCMIFYVPMAPPNLQGLPASLLDSRLPRYKAIVDKCLEIEQTEGIINLSSAAACIYERYPNALEGFPKTSLNSLRGVAVFLGYMPPNFERAGYEYVLMAGNVFSECIPKIIDKTRAFPELCHAALFSHSEYIPKPRAKRKRDP